MKITAIDPFVVGADLEEPFAFSQFTYRRRESMICRVRTEEGVEGWGDSYGPASVNAAALAFLAQHATGRDPRDTDANWSHLYARTVDFAQKGSILAALSALDIACWDIKAQAAGVPLYRLLGAAHTERLRAYATGFYFGGERSLTDRFGEEARSHVEAGFGAVKMKVGLGVREDARLVEAVRAAIGSNVRLMIDANHAYTPTEAVALGRRVEHLDIGWFEEPVSPLDIEGYLEVKRSLAMPVAGGECEFTRFGFEPWLRRRALDYAQPDLCQCGGISEGIKIAAMASAHGVHVTPHAWGTGIGLAAAIHFYAARPRSPFTLTEEEKWLECDRTENPLRSRLVREPIEPADGYLPVPQSPGLGVSVDEDALREFASQPIP